MGCVIGGAVLDGGGVEEHEICGEACSDLASRALHAACAIWAEAACAQACHFVNRCLQRKQTLLTAITPENSGKTAPQPWMRALIVCETIRANQLERMRD